MIKRPIKRKINFTCKTCSVEFISKKACKSRVPKFCSKTCFSESNKKHLKCHFCNGPMSWVNKKFCSKNCFFESRRGTKMSEESKSKMSLAKKGKPILHLHNEKTVEKIKKSLTGRPNLNMRGKNHPRYLNGGAKTTERLFEMGRIEYKNWRRSVYERDQYTCCLCKKKGGKLNADHIKPWSIYPDLRYDLNNGRTLCVECHRKTDTFGGVRIKKYETVHVIRTEQEEQQE